MVLEPTLSPSLISRPMPPNLTERDLGLADYEATWLAMKEFTQTRGPDQPCELWVCQHPPVFTLGQAGDPAHLLMPGSIPLVQTDRGGQITYHGPGQIVVYPLLQLNRYGLRVREYVNLLEQVLIDCLVDQGVADAQRKPAAPGVYTQHRGQLAKIAALGIKVRQGCTYHGLSLNVAMDLAPFSAINPCGYAGLETVDLSSIGVKISLDEMKAHLMKKLNQRLVQAQSAAQAKE